MEGSRVSRHAASTEAEFKLLLDACPQAGMSTHGPLYDSRGPKAGKRKKLSVPKD